MKGLTKRQREIVDYIQEFIANNRYSPSYREISQRFGFSSLGSVYNHITALKDKGALINQANIRRSILPTSADDLSASKTGVEIPFIGQITAGKPIHTFPQSKSITIPHSLVQIKEKTYALQVKGDTFHEEMIGDDDLLIIETRQEAYHGETVLALINEHDMIIKKYFPQGDFVRLVGSLARHHPIILRQKDVAIQGIIVGLLRNYQRA